VKWPPAWELVSCKSVVKRRFYVCFSYSETLINPLPEYD
jgi:hypothetical protein